MIAEKGRHRTREQTFAALAANKISVTPLPARSHGPASSWLNWRSRYHKGDDPPADHAAGVERMEFMLSLRRYGIMDAAVLRAMDDVPREYFVSVEQTALAYADHALPIPCRQTISQPFIVAYMTEQLRLRPEHRVLEIGTGSGYQAAMLSRIALSSRQYRTLSHAC